MRTHDSPGLPDQRLAQIARKVAESTGGRAPVSSEQGWQILLAKTPSLGRPDSQPVLPNVKTQLAGGSSRFWWRRIAMASGVAVACLGLALVWRSLILPGVSGDARVYRTIPGQQALLTLRDGSRILLAPGSRLQVEPIFGRVARTVALSGEAYFDVVSHEHAPFVVNTEDVTTRVLGTTFAVKRYASDTVTRVAVASGAVAVSGGQSRAVTLTAGQFAIASDSVTQVRIGDEAIQYTRWAQGDLEFSATPLPDVLQIVGRWYGIHFRIADSSLVNVTLTARLAYNSRANMLADLQALLGVSMAFGTSGDSTIVTLTQKRHFRIHDQPLRRKTPPFQTFREVGR